MAEASTPSNSFASCRSARVWDVEAEPAATSGAKRSRICLRRSNFVRMLSAVRLIIVLSQDPKRSGSPHDPSAVHARIRASCATSSAASALEVCARASVTAVLECLWTRMLNAAVLPSWEALTSCPSERAARADSLMALRSFHQASSPATRSRRKWVMGISRPLGSVNTTPRIKNSPSNTSSSIVPSYISNPRGRIPFM